MSVIITETKAKSKKEDFSTQRHRDTEKYNRKAKVIKA